MRDKLGDRPGRAAIATDRDELANMAALVMGR
jgi:hypothetical protein